MYLQDGSIRNIFGSVRTSSDTIRALRKILALSGEKCHAYKLKKVGRYIINNDKIVTILEQGVFFKLPLLLPYREHYQPTPY